MEPLPYPLDVTPALIARIFSSPASSDTALRAELREVNQAHLLVYTDYELRLRRALAVPERPEQIAKSASAGLADPAASVWQGALAGVQWPQPSRRVEPGGRDNDNGREEIER